MNSSRFDRILRQALIVPVVIVLLGAATLYWQMHQANLTVTQIQHADESLAQSLLVERLIIDEETGLRGFQTTGDRRFLEPYLASERRLPAELDRRRALATIPARRTVVNNLQAAHEAWRQGFAEPVIASVMAGGHASGVELNLIGKRQMDDMRQRLDDLSSVPQRRRDEYIAHWRSQVRVSSWAVATIALLMGLTIGLYTRRRLHEVSDAFKQSNHVLRLRAEEAFRSEQKLRTTLQSIADGVIVCDAEGCVDSMNEVSETLTGWNSLQAHKLPLEKVFNVIDHTSRKPLENPVSKVKRLNQVVTLANHTILVRKDGTEIFIDDSGAPIRDKQGRLIGVVLVFRDITMAIKSQDALIANEKLAVAGRLSATIAHEIHNPLDSIANLLYLMNGQSTPEENRHFLQLAQQEIARVTQISRAMLSLYRESAAPVPIDLAEMLASVLLLMDRRFAILGVQIQTDMMPNLIVQGYPGELRQVFTNLLTNAAEACEAEGKIHVAARPCPADTSDECHHRDPGVLVTVTDNGPGIPQEVQSSLFQPFFTTKGQSGTGLGLWVSRGIVTKHGGTIHFDSNTGSAHHGTTVSVFLATNPTINAGGD